MMTRAARSAPTLAELEEALTMAAYIVCRHGEAYAPIMDRLEREVDEARRRVPSIERARRLLAALPATAERPRAVQSTL